MFKKLVKGRIVALFAITLLLPQASIAQNEEVPVKKITEMLYPSVLVDLGEGAGSGTIVFSGKRTHESWKEEKTWTLVLTNHHVIQDEEAQYTIIFNDGSEYSARVLSVDPLEDVAVLQLLSNEKNMYLYVNQKSDIFQNTIENRLKTITYWYTRESFR